MKGLVIIIGLLTFSLLVLTLSTAKWKNYYLNHRCMLYESENVALDDDYRKITGFDSIEIFSMRGRLEVNFCFPNKWNKYWNSYQIDTAFDYSVYNHYFDSGMVYTAVDGSGSFIITKDRWSTSGGGFPDSIGKKDYKPLTYNVDSMVDIQSKQLDSIIKKIGFFNYLKIRLNELTNSR